jgi:glycosyltransferase involved in cell wall biosynthesis
VEAAGVEVHLIHAGGRAYLQERRLTMKLIRDWRADVVHTHGYRADVVTGMAAARAGVPTVSTVHGFTGGDIKNRFYELLQLRAFRRMDAVIAVSSPLRQKLIQAGVAAPRVHRIRNAWAPPSPSLSRHEARAVLGLPDSDTIIGWVGRLSPEKGADLFLQALARGPWLASVIGDGRAGGELRRTAEVLGLADRVRWHGLVPSAGRLVSAFDLLVLSSRTEGTPIVLFEAMEAGVPIVASAVGGVPDVLGPDEALLVPPGDPDRLAEAMRAVFGDLAGAAARASRARARLATDFAAGPWLDQYESLYHSLLPDSRRGP